MAETLLVTETRSFIPGVPHYDILAREKDGWLLARAFLFMVRHHFIPDEYMRSYLEGETRRVWVVRGRYPARGPVLFCTGAVARAVGASPVLWAFRPFGIRRLLRLRSAAPAKGSKA